MRIRACMQYLQWEWAYIINDRGLTPGSGLSIIINHLKPEFTIVIFIQYKPRIAVAILDL